MKQGADMLDEPSVIYRTNSTIRGVAIHVASAQLYISDATGDVYRTSIMESSPPVIVLNSNQTNFKPLSLSVDWLNSHLYVLGEVKHATTVWQLARCTLNGRDLRVAMAVFLTRPSHIEVDPYNGYLFWVTRGGLYRLDLDAFNGAIKQQVNINKHLFKLKALDAITKFASFYQLDPTIFDSGRCISGCFRG